mmetsp:Transcript_3602/g.5823  ORF Transcript_3602/g.5823 Transcript_3602/m.5823 type:complete len:251 (+) Transcript_3602:42-794(+)
MGKVIAILCLLTYLEASRTKPKRSMVKSMLLEKDPAGKTWDNEFFTNPKAPLRRLGNLYGWGTAQLSIPGHGTQSWLYMPLIALALKDLEADHGWEYGSVGNRLKVAEDQETFWRKYAADDIAAFKDHFKSKWGSLKGVLNDAGKWGDRWHLDGSVQEQVAPDDWEGAILIFNLMSIPRAQESTVNSGPTGTTSRITTTTTTTTLKAGVSTTTTSTATTTTVSTKNGGRRADTFSQVALLAFAMCAQIDL